MKDDPRDKLLESLLDEVLGGVKPPDLKQPILHRAGATNADGSRDITAPPVQRAPRIATAHVGRSTLRPNPRYAAWLGLGLTAAVALLAVGRMVAVRFAGDAPAELARESRPTAEPVRPGGTADTGTARRAAAPGDDAMASDRSMFDERRLPFETPGDARTAEHAIGAQRVATLPDADVTRMIDRQLASVWKQQNVTPAERADDAEWCRRAYVRLVGRIPTVDELNRFTADTPAGNRERLVNGLLASSEYEEEFVRHWSVLWSNVLIGRRGGMEDGSPASREGLEQYLRDAIRVNKPYDQMAYELVSATGAAVPGSPDFNGAVNFLLASMNDRGILATSRICNVFLGQKRQCAQCHNHPANDWDQHDFWQVNALLRQMRIERGEHGVQLVDRDFDGERRGSSDGEIYYERPSGAMKVAYPVLPDGTAIARSGKVTEVNRRRELAEYLRSAPELSQAMVNRMWSHFFGYGFTRPVDDMGGHNPASHPELLEQLAGQFAAHGYDTRRLIRWLALSDAFQRTSRASEGNLADAPESGTAPLFARYYARQLQPEEVFQSLTLVADAANQPSVIETAAARQVWLGQISSNMGTDEGDETHAFTGGIRQSLIMMHGTLTERATSTGEGTMLARLASSEMDTDAKIDHLFLAAVARKPSRRELALARRIVASRGDQQISGLQDIWWALLNSNEFILDH